MTANIVTFANKFAANRSAVRQGLTSFDLVKQADARWAILETTPASAFEAPAEELALQTVRPVAEPAAELPPVVAAAAKAIKPAMKPANEVKPAKDAKAIKGPTFKQRVLDMCTVEGGTTIEAITAALGNSPVAARALIGDLRRDGSTIVSVPGKAGEATRYIAK